MILFTGDLLFFSLTQSYRETQRVYLPSGKPLMAQGSPLTVHQRAAAVGGGGQ